MTAANADSLAARLDEFARTLSDDEAEILSRLLVSAMNPMERLRHLDHGDLLTPAEWRALRGASPA